MREQLLREVRQPEVVAGRCVHALTETASCRACVDACPQRAWLLDDEALGLDTDACDGCGLCVPACSEGALALPREPLYLRRGTEVEALVACEKAVPAGGEGVLPCLHALGPRDLRRLAALDVRHWSVSHGDCDGCERGGGVRLGQAIKDLGRALTERGCEPITAQHLPAHVWSARVAHGVQASADEAEPMGRRAFLRRAVHRAVETSLHPRGLLNREQAEFQPLGRLLPPSSYGTVSWPFVPRLEPERCVGCDACVRLCPHGAIALHEDKQGSVYRLRPMDCSGCGMCVDTCEPGAVTVETWVSWEQTEVPLRRARCRSCGTPFHLPEAAADDQGRCPICHTANHNRLLYQVLQ